jgi:glycosyltransferase involved in cell wall biosynthesis
MRFLRVIATLDPRHGGPSAGLRAITPELSALGHTTDFVSIDPPDSRAILSGGHAHYRLGPARGGYAYSARLEPWLRQHAPDYDAVFVHGLWQYHGRAVRAVLRRQPTPYFVFPHGMLDPWFRRAYPMKHLKKWAYWQLCERHVLRDAAAVCFTCEQERRLARQSFRPYACRERVVAYGTVAPEPADDRQLRAWRDAQPELAGRPFWLFLGRIHPKKGVDLLLQAYARLARESAAPLPALVIAGPWTDARYRAHLESIERTLPPGARVVWPDMLEGDRKWGALRAADAFVLPSHQENFGIAVAESLAVGTPVLISRQVNIADEITAAGAGLVECDDAEGTRRLLRAWQSLAKEERQRMRDAASALFQQRYEIHRVARSLVETIAPFVSPASALIRP